MSGGAKSLERGAGGRSPRTGAAGPVFVEGLAGKPAAQPDLRWRAIVASLSSGCIRGRAGPPGRPSFELRPSRGLGMWLLAAGIFATAGCGVVPKLREDHTRFFSLSVPAAPAAAATAPATDLPRILVRRVELPTYLQAKKFAVRHEGTEIDYVDDIWWSEAIDLGIARVLRERLASLGVPAVARRDEGYDFELIVRVAQFEGAIVEGKGAAAFRASFELQPLAGGRTPVRRSFAPEPGRWDGRNYDELTQSLGAAVAALADAVKAALPGN